MWPRLHRWAAIILVAPLIVWSITGLLFHLKPGWKRAYDMLSIERPLEDTNVAAIQSLPPFKQLELFGTAIGPREVRKARWSMSIALQGRFNNTGKTRQESTGSTGFTI